MKKYGVHGDIAFCVNVFDGEVELTSNFYAEFDSANFDGDFAALDKDVQRQVLLDYIQDDNPDLPALLDVWIDSWAELPED